MPVQVAPLLLALAATHTGGSVPKITKSGFSFNALWPTCQMSTEHIAPYEIEYFL